MGDSGSMLIGLVLSASAITLTGQYSGADLSQGAMGSPGEPGADLPAAGAADHPPGRARSPTWCWPSSGGPAPGRSPFAPDKQHLHHRLLEIGHSQRRAVLIMWMWAALVAGGTVVVSLYTGPADVGR